MVWAELAVGGSAFLMDRLPFVLIPEKMVDGSEIQNLT